MNWYADWSLDIDFGFLLSNSPGSVGFEAAPFKLTHEYVELIGGVKSEGFEIFRALLKCSFKALRKKADDIVVLVEMMQKRKCFRLKTLTCSGDYEDNTNEQNRRCHASVMGMRPQSF